MRRFFGAVGGNLEKTQLHQFWILLENWVFFFKYYKDFFLIIIEEMPTTHWHVPPQQGSRVTVQAVNWSACCARLPPINESD